MNLSDSSLPASQSEPRSLCASKPLLTSRVQTLQARGSGLTGGGGLEKSSSLGELRGSSASVLAASSSTRSLCIMSDITDSLGASSSSSGGTRGTGLQAPSRRSPVEQDGGAETKSSSQKRILFRNFFRNK